MSSAKSVLVVVGSIVLMSCGGSSSNSSPSEKHAVGGTVSGLTGSGLVLQDNGGDDLAVAAAESSFVFATQVGEGKAYLVTVKTQPASPAQSCAVANGSGTVGSADVTSVTVACTSAHALTTTVTGLLGSGLVLTGTFGSSAAVDSPAISANGDVPSMSSASLAAGSSYTIAVKTQPTSPAQTCAIAGAPSVTGTVADADVAIAVTCAPQPTVVQRFTAPTTWGGTTSFWPDDANMVEHATFNATTLVETKSASAPVWVGGGTEPTPRATTAFPAATRRAGGPFPTLGRHYEAPTADPSLDLGKLGDASTDMLVCAVVKPDYDPVDSGQEHPIIAKGVGDGTRNVQGGGWVLMQMHESFCFHYEGWDGSTSASSLMNMTFTPTYFAGRDPKHVPSDIGTSPLNPTYVVVCAGRDGNQLRIAANGYVANGYEAMYGDMLTSLAAGTRLHAGSAYPLTLGGYSTAATAALAGGYGLPHVFGGRIYETAVWKIAASPENLQAKLAAVQGIPDGASYTRNREGPFVAADGTYHTAWRNGPRIDATKGYLFGLQGWNRLSRWKTVADGPPDVAVYAYGEAFDLWTANSGSGGAPTVATDTAVSPPGDAATYSQRITLPAGSSLSTTLGAFDAAGGILGQIWLRVPTGFGTGTLRLGKTGNASGGSDHFDVNLATVTPANSWKRIWLHRGSGGAGNELTTDGLAGATLYLENLGASPIEFYAWGLDLTQLGLGVVTGKDLGAFDPGLAMYDWGSDNDTINASDTAGKPLDVLQLPDIADTTAETGFCLSVTAQPADGLGWDAPFNEQRNLLTWHDAPDFAKTARLYVDGGGNAGALCMYLEDIVSSTVTEHYVTCSVQGAHAWTAGSQHNLKGCLSAAGQMRIYADDVLVSDAVATVPVASVPDVDGGHLLVGNAGSRPWHGYVESALLCRDTGTLTDCK